MAKKISDNDLVMDGYKALFAAATPSVDFEELVNNCLRYVDKEGKTHFTDKPLTTEECTDRGWFKDIFHRYSQQSHTRVQEPTKRSFGSVCHIPQRVDDGL